MIRKNRRFLESVVMMTVLFWVGEGRPALQQCSPGSGSGTLTVSSFFELQEAIANAKSGDDIVVAAGTYTGHLTLRASNVIVRAATPGSGVLRDTIIDVRGNDNILSSFSVEGASSIRIFGNSNRILANSFNNGIRTTKEVIAHIEILENASNNTVSYNEIANFRKRGIRIAPGKGLPQKNVISYNYIHDDVGAPLNGVEPIQIGVGAGDTAKNLGAIVEFNLVERTRVDGETISVKSSGNTIRNNTFAYGRGGPTLRVGSNNLFQNNTVINMQVVRVFGDNHRIIGNRLINTELQIPQGDATEDDVIRGAHGVHPAARNTQVVANTVTGKPLTVGGGRYSGYPASGTVLAENTANVRLLNNQVATTFQDNCDCNPGTPVQLSAGEVGPGRLSCTAMGIPVNKEQDLSKEAGASP